MPSSAAANPTVALFGVVSYPAHNQSANLWLPSSVLVILGTLSAFEGAVVRGCTSTNFLTFQVPCRDAAKPTVALLGEVKH